MTEVTENLLKHKE